MQSSALIDAVHSVLAQDPTIKVQYISIVQAGTMDQVQTVGSTDVVIAAVVIDGVRLIDNMSFANA
jgi:pantothenate synthetase